MEVKMATELQDVRHGAPRKCEGCGGKHPRDTGEVCPHCGGTLRSLTDEELMDDLRETHPLANPGSDQCFGTQSKGFLKGS